MHCTVVPSANNCNFQSMDGDELFLILTHKACFFYMPEVPFPCSSSFRKKLTTKQSWNNRAGIELKTSSPANHSAIPISLHRSHLRQVPTARDMNWRPESWKLSNFRVYLSASGAEDNSATAPPKKLDWLKYRSNIWFVSIVPEKNAGDAAPGPGSVVGDDTDTDAERD